ncbi:hypothetical protein ABPG75_002000 [Micractinium tetrahymenae]
MPPIPVPGAAAAGGSEGGGSEASSEEFAVDELQVLLGSSLPDHHLCVVGSLGGLPASLPRSFAAWPPPTDVYRAPALGDPEAGNHFTFHPSNDSAMEVPGEAEGGDEQDVEAAHGQARAAAPAAPAPEDAGEALPGGAAKEAAAEPSGQPSEAARILRLAAPLSASNLAGYAISMVAIAFVGRLGEEALSVVVLATSVFNVTGLAVLIGFASAMETFCSQAYGAGRYHLVGLVLQRALLLLSLLAAAVAAAWTQAEPLLLALGQDPAIARGTAQFLLRAAPGLWFTGIFEALKRYLMAQEAVRPATVVTTVALCLAPLYNWLLIFRAGLGLHGAAYAMVALQATLALLLAAVCVGRDRLLSGTPLATWHGFSRKAWSGWGTYCRFALPSVAMLCCEWSTFEVMVLMSGLLPNPAVSVSTMGLVINTSGLAYMAVTGLACAASIRIGHSLGAAQPGQARRTAWTAWGLTMCLQAVVAAGIVLARHSWPRLFTDSPAVVARTAQLLPLFALSLFGDGTNAVLQGLLRGAGRQHLGAVTNLISYWCCGIPLAAFLAFRRGLGLEGLWWGLVVINTLQGGIMLTLAYCFDFEAQAERAAALLHQAAARSAEADVPHLLLEPLLPSGSTEAGAGRAARRRGAASEKRRGSLDVDGIKRRLSVALLLLLTEGAHTRRSHVAAPRGRRGPKASANEAQ